MRVLVAPDKFKGSLSAREAAEAIARGLLQSGIFQDKIELRPIADGGEGFADALAKWKIFARAHDALGREIVADYGWLDAETAVVEMSAASGLWRIAPHERDPLRANTFGTGELMRDALARGAKKILVGLGGSATNDGGIGMAAALGYEFVTSDGEPLKPLPENLLALMHIKPPRADNKNDAQIFQPPFFENGELQKDDAAPIIIAACDVENPLLGERGASRIYGPQKGADARTIETLELSLEQLADIVAQDLDCDFRDAPGAGAAGGLGFGLMSFCGAKMRSGFEIIAEAHQLEKTVAASDFVITGEGRIDAQTLFGKGPARIAALARKHGKPVIAFAGAVENETREQLAQIFDAMIEIAPRDVSQSESMRDAAHFLENAAMRAAGNFRA